MDDTTVLGGSARAGGAFGRGWRVPPGHRRVAPDRYAGWKRSPLTAHAERIVVLVIDNPDHFMRTEALHMSMPTVSGGRIDAAAGTSHGGCRVRSSSS